MVAIFAHAQVVASSTHAVVGELALQMLLHLHRVEMVIQRKFQCFFALLVKGKDLLQPVQHELCAARRGEGFVALNPPFCNAKPSALEESVPL